MKNEGNQVLQSNKALIVKNSLHKMWKTCISCQQYNNYGVFRIDFSRTLGQNESSFILVRLANGNVVPTLSPPLYLQKEIDYMSVNMTCGISREGRFQYNYMCYIRYLNSL